MAVSQLQPDNKYRAQIAQRIVEGLQEALGIFPGVVAPIARFSELPASSQWNSSNLRGTPPRNGGTSARIDAEGIGSDFPYDARYFHRPGISTLVNASVGELSNQQAAVTNRRLNNAFIHGRRQGNLYDRLRFAPTSTPLFGYDRDRGRVSPLPEYRGAIEMSAVPNFFNPVLNWRADSAFEITLTVVSVANSRDFSESTIVYYYGDRSPGGGAITAATMANYRGVPASIRHEFFACGPDLDLGENVLVNDNWTWTTLLGVVNQGMPDTISLMLFPESEPGAGSSAEDDLKALATQINNAAGEFIFLSPSADELPLKENLVIRSARYADDIIYSAKGAQNSAQNMVAGRPSFVGNARMRPADVARRANETVEAPTLDQIPSALRNDAALQSRLRNDFVYSIISEIYQGPLGLPVGLRYENTDLWVPLEDAGNRAHFVREVSIPDTVTFSPRTRAAFDSYSSTVTHAQSRLWRSGDPWDTRVSRKGVIVELGVKTPQGTILPATPFTTLKRGSPYEPAARQILEGPIEGPGATTAASRRYPQEYSIIGASLNIRAISTATAFEVEGPGSLARGVLHVTNIGVVGGRDKKLSQIRAPSPRVTLSDDTEITLLPNVRNIESSPVRGREVITGTFEPAQGVEFENASDLDGLWTIDGRDTPYRLRTANAEGRPGIRSIQVVLEAQL